LGSGTSHGVPVIGCSCPVCLSGDGRDKRYRSSIYIEGAGGEKILVDTPPEFRLQAIRTGIKELDLVLLTHSHADHLHGLDDLRPLTYEKKLNIYANELCYNELEARFNYIWKEGVQIGGGLPRLEAHLVNDKMYQNGFQTDGSIAADTGGNGIKITPLPVYHGKLNILGSKFEEYGKTFVYLTDVKTVPEETFKKVVPCNLLIIGGIKIIPHATHFSFGEALDFAKKIFLEQGGGLNSVYITHICHNHSHKEIENFCANWKSKNKEVTFTASPSHDTQTIVLA